MANQISLKTFSDFLNANGPESLFYIPAYQRGYRWQPKQVKELLDDLYSFACKKKNDGEFYCLQPLIVKRITSHPDLPDALKGIADKADIWEVIDGQQRLTTLRVIYRYLMLKKGLQDNDSLSEEMGMRLFHIFYESRYEDFEYIENIGNQPPTGDHCNIDTNHIYAAIAEIDRWIKEDAPQWSALYGKNSTPYSIRELLFQLLNTSSSAVSESCGRVKFLWYELDADADNAVKEFLDVNNGKIPLTDSELIKALFLKQTNASITNSGKTDQMALKNIIDESLRQDRWAKKWERMENCLNDNAFWSFISTDILAEDRMSILFELIYLRHHNGEKPEKGDIFRYYYRSLSSNSGKEAFNALNQKWQELNNEFRLLTDWHNDAILYNLIGLLINNDKTLYDIRIIYDKGCRYDEFVKNLKAELACILAEKVDTKEQQINVTYKKRQDVRRILLFINVAGMMSELEHIRKPQAMKANTPEEQEMLKERPRLSPPAYKFPFDLMKLQQWDVEHIDSATTNKLKKKEDIMQWIITSYMELEGFPTDMFRETHELHDIKNKEDLEMILTEMSQEKLDAVKDDIRRRYEGGENDDDLKDQIGNLTLLDYQTNREYGNALYPVKRKKIFKAIKNGRYVPLMTRMAFSKAFSPDSSLLRWSADDKRGYHAFVYDMITRFINENSIKNGK